MIALPPVGAQGGNHVIYLDYSANAPVDERVLAAFCDAERSCIGNANSVHAAGQLARSEMERAVASIAAGLGAQADEVILTSGASEANNLAIKGIARASRHLGRHIISTPLEHASVSGALTALQEQGWEIDLPDVRRDGTIDLEQLRSLLRRDTVLVAISWVDSELGTVQPVRQVSELLRDFPQCRLHVDATQAVGKIPLSFEGIDTLSFAPHKFGGLNGSGVLLKRRGLAIEPLIHGGASTTIYRSGTPAVGLAVAAARALELALKELEDRRAVVQAHNGRLRTALSAYPKLRINSPGGRDPPHPQPERGGGAGRGGPAGAERKGRVRVGQVRLFSGEYAVPGGVRGEPRQEERAGLLAHQPEPPHHRRRARRLSFHLRRMLQGGICMPRELTKQQLIERSINKKFRKELWTPFVAAIKRYALIQVGDRIAVCISGGKDSMLMAKLMQELQRHSDVPFELVFLVMDPGYNEINRRKIESNAALLGIPITIFETDVFAVANSAEENPCYLCARMRRGYLYSKAQALGCNKIALGHHRNDVIETVVMSMFYGSQLQSMPPKLHSANFEGMELIRPMYCIREEDILAWKRYNELEFIQCACRFTENCTMCDNGGGGSKRQEIKTLLRRLSRDNPDLETSIFNSMHAVCLDTMAGYKSKGVKHSFLERYDDKA